MLNLFERIEKRYRFKKKKKKKDAERKREVYEE